jgi:hypothetical protein
MNKSHCTASSILIVTRCLTNAGWIEKSDRHSGGGLKWTSKGIGRLFFLQHIIEEFNLAKEVDGPIRFTKDCESQPVTGRMTSQSAAKQFWLACLEELTLNRESATVWEFVQVVVLGDEVLAKSLPSHGATGFRLNDTIEIDEGDQGQQFKSQRTKSKVGGRG